MDEILSQTPVQFHGIRSQITLDEKDLDTIRNQSHNPLTDQQEKPNYKTAKVKIGGIEFIEIGIRKKGFDKSQSSERPSLNVPHNQP